MPTNPKDIHEAFTLLVTRLLPMQPHHIRYEADEADWRERIEHLQRIAVAFDAYLKELGRDCAQHARNSFDAKAFVDPIGDAHTLRQSDVESDLRGWTVYELLKRNHVDTLAAVLALRK